MRYHISHLNIIEEEICHRISCRTQVTLEWIKNVLYQWITSNDILFSNLWRDIRIVSSLDDRVLSPRNSISHQGFILGIKMIIFAIQIPLSNYLDTLKNWHDKQLGSIGIRFEGWVADKGGKKGNVGCKDGERFRHWTNLCYIQP